MNHMIFRYGFESVANIPQGLWIRTYKSIIEQVKILGFNTIRITFSSEMLRSDSIAVGIDYYRNPELQGLSPLQCMDVIIGYAGSIGLRVILSRFTSKTGNILNEPLWYIPGDAYYTAERFQMDWVNLATRFAGSAVIGADLWNEPSIVVTWGDGTGNDWKAAAESTGNAILAVNPEWLVFVAGVTLNSWSGSYHRGVLTSPLVLNIPNKLVYTIHEYTLDTLSQPWFTSPSFPATLRPVWDSNFGFLVRNSLSPILVAGFGASFKFPSDDLWFPRWMNYTNGEYSQEGVSDLSPGQFGMSWTYWALNPGGSIGGILNDDWKTVDSRKMKFLKRSLAPLFSVFNQLPTANPAIAPSARPTTLQTTLTPSTASPTLTPTKPVFPYYHTAGSQIVDRNGRAIRISGVNWSVLTLCFVCSTVVFKSKYIFCFY